MKKNLISKIIFEINNDKYLNLIVGMPGMKKTFITQKITENFCKCPLLIKGVNLTIDKVNTIELSKYDGVVVDEIASIPKDMIENIIYLINQVKILQIPLIATAPSFDEMNKKTTTIIYIL